MTGEGDVCGGAGGVGGDDGEVWGCGVEGGEVVGERADVVGGVMRVGEHGDGGCAVCGGLGAASVRVLRALVIAVMGLSSRVRVRWVVGGVSLGSIAQAWWVRWVASAMSLGCGVAWGKAAAVCGWVARLVMWRLLVCVSSRSAVSSSVVMWWVPVRMTSAPVRASSRANTGVRRTTTGWGASGVWGGVRERSAM